MAILNLFQGVFSGSGLPMQAKSVPPALQVPEAGQPTAGFSDALSSAIGTLLAGQGAPSPVLPGEEPDVLSGEEAKPAAQPLLKDDAHQQLLATLLTGEQAAALTITDTPAGRVASSTPLIPDAKPIADATHASPARHRLLASQGVPPGLPATQHQPAPPVPPTAGVDPAAAAPAAPAVSPSAVADITQIMPVATSTPASTSPALSAGHPATSAPSMPATALKMDAEPSRWSEQLQSALGERLQVQVKQQIQHATIRLDPPDMGKIDIAMQIESGRVQVHISASHAEVYRALQQTSNELRQSLTEQNFVQVNVQVSSQSGGQQQGRGQQFNGQPEAILAGAEVAAHSSDRDDARRDSSVLLTV